MGQEVPDGAWQHTSCLCWPSRFAIYISLGAQFAPRQGESGSELSRFVKDQGQAAWRGPQKRARRLQLSKELRTLYSVSVCIRLSWAAVFDSTSLYAELGSTRAITAPFAVIVAAPTDIAVMSRVQ